jgi:hypothetical protein
MPTDVTARDRYAPNPTANRNVTTRINYDQTLRPTLLLHIGVGYIQQYQPTDYPNFDQGSLGMKGYFQTNRFPSIGGFFDGSNPSGTNIAAGTHALFAVATAAECRWTWSGLHCLPLGGEADLPTSI